MQRIKPNMSGTVWTQIEPAKMTGGNEGIQGTASWGFQGHFTKGRTSRILLSRLSLSKTDTNIIKCRFKGVRSGGGIQLEIRNKKGRGRGSSKAANETLKSNWTTARQTEVRAGQEPVATQKVRSEPVGRQVHSREARKVSPRDPSVSLWATTEHICR